MAWFLPLIMMISPACLFWGAATMESVNFTKSVDRESFQLLSETIAGFNGVASKLESYYRNLEQRVKHLTLELDEKNRELVQNLREKEEFKNYLHNILESLTTGVVVLDLEGRITTFNRAAEMITGLGAADMSGCRFDRTPASGIFSRLTENRGSSNDITEDLEVETEIQRGHNDTLHVRISTFPVKDPAGRKIGTAITLQDITRLKRLEEKVNRRDRLAAMGEMAAEIAHEIRNPLGSIELFATTLKKDLSDSPELQRLVEHISRSVRKMNNSISNLLMFIRPHQRPCFRIKDIHGPLTNALLFSSDLLKSDNPVEVVTHYATEPLTARIDPDLLQQALLNLILNALQAMPRGGELRISTTRRIHPRSGSGVAEIQIRDSGSGVCEKNLARIFDPFFTTKKKGTGLGLAIVHNILSIHGGDIDVESFPEQGTLCTVTIPLWEEDNGTS
ncbi:MAG: PAS domain-containing sensor histidine kinase [Deltaproteobacteria bacterium]|nr:MAG: PAS domain-containing sensor histidine kinase [Deltaproteobacteria bacterium]